MKHDLGIDSELAGYRIQALVGRGGMGVVYRAEQLRLGRAVALKVLAPSLAADDEFRERFERESRLAALIDHPNIVPVYEAGEADGLLFIAMRWVEGSDLGALLKRAGPLDPERALALLGQVGSALDAAHERGLVHRDVKPGNVLIVDGSARSRVEHVYLTDFGIAKMTTSGGLTRTGMFLGTPDYAAPEQFEGTELDGRSDVYALACLLFQCLAGSRPFERTTEIAVMYAHLHDPPPRVSELRRGLPVSLDAVIATGMAKKREERYASCHDLIEAADAALAGQGEHTIAAPQQPIADPTIAATTAPAATPPAPAASEAKATSPADRPPPAPPPPATRPAPPPPPGEPGSELGSEPAGGPVRRAKPGLAPARRRRRGAALALGALLIAGGAAAALVLTLGGGGGTEAETAAASTDAGVTTAGETQAPTETAESTRAATTEAETAAATTDGATDVPTGPLEPAWSSVESASFSDAPLAESQRIAAAGEDAAVAVGSQRAEDDLDAVFWRLTGISSGPEVEAQVLREAGDQVVYGVAPVGETGSVAVGYRQEEPPRGDATAAVWLSAGAEFEPVDGVGGDSAFEKMNRVATGPNGEIVAVGAAGPGYSDGTVPLPTEAAAWISTDGGEAWERMDTEDLSKDGYQEMRSVTAAGDGFVAVGYDTADAAVWRFVDGSWHQVEEQPDLVVGDRRTKIQMRDVAGWQDGLIAVGDYVDPEFGDRDGGVWLSDDGDEWTQVYAEALAQGTDEQLLGVVTGDFGIVVVGCSDCEGEVVPTVWTSEDGLEWTRAEGDLVPPFDGSQQMNSVAAVAGELVAAGWAEADERSAAAWIASLGVAGE